MFSRDAPAFSKYASSHGISRSFGVARVMSVCTMQMRASGVIDAASAGAAMGWVSAENNAARSPVSPRCGAGSMIVAPSGTSTSR